MHLFFVFFLVVVFLLVGTRLPLPRLGFLRLLGLGLGLDFERGHELRDKVQAPVHLRLPLLDDEELLEAENECRLKLLFVQLLKKIESKRNANVRLIMLRN